MRSTSEPILTGTRVVELAARGPAPYGVMLLADLGAEVIRIDRPTADGIERLGETVTGRGRRSIAIDLKQADGLALLLGLVDHADVLVEGYRPGVAERLGFGPEVCHARNARLVYARMTGWGQVGPLAARAGHDINYLAVAGGLHPIGDADRPPPPPLNLVADYGGGGTFLVIGILAALLERERSGIGQVLDVAMVDGVSSLLTAFHALHGMGLWRDERGANLLDGGAPWYRTYRTADDRFVAVGCLEPGFYRILLDRLGLDPEAWPQYDEDVWPALHEELARIFGAEPRSHWEAVFEGIDACVTPVLTLDEAARSAQLVARETLVSTADGLVPGPAPRFSRTPSRVAERSRPPAEDSDWVLDVLGVPPDARRELRRRGVVS